MDKEGKTQYEMIVHMNESITGQQKAPPEAQEQMDRENVDKVQDGAADKSTTSKEVLAGKGQEVEEALNLGQDHGFAWLIVLGAFIGTVLTGSLNRCSGLFFLQFQNKYGTNAQLTAWPISLLNTIHLFMGPIVSVLCHRYSSRTCMFLGCTIASVGLVLTGFSQSFGFLFFSYTFLSGIGRGLMAGPGTILLMKYFEKKLSLAVGVATSGGGLGTFFVVPLVQLLFDSFGFQGAFLIIGSIPLHGWLAALLYRPYKTQCAIINASARKRLRKQGGIPGNAKKHGSLTESLERHDHLAQERQVDILIPRANQETTSISRENGTTSVLYSGHLPLTERNGAESEAQASEHENKESAASLGLDDDMCIDFNCNENTSDCPESEHCLRRGERNSKVPGLQAPESIRSRLCGGSSKRSTTGARWNKPPTDTNQFSRGYKKPKCLRPTLKILFPVENERSQKKESRAFHFELFKHSAFIVHNLSAAFFSLAVQSVFTFLPALAKSRGLSNSEAALTLTVIGASDVFGRIGFGFFLDRPKIRRWKFSMYCALVYLVAVVSCSMPLLSGVSEYLAVAGLCGLLTGAHMSQRSVMLAGMVGKEKIGSALGILKWFLGFGNLIGPPTLGALRDAFAGYDVSFYVAGASLLVSALLMSLSNLLLVLGPGKGDRSEQEREAN